MPSTIMSIQPIAGPLGAEILGADLRELDDESFGMIHKAFLDHPMIFFRDQDRLQRN